MTLDRVRLRWVPGGGAAAGSQAALRELTGADELALMGSSTSDAIALLDRLLEAEPGSSLGPGEALNLCAADRDRLLAAVYARTYGPLVQSSLPCRACGRPFDLEFSLPDLVSELDERSQMATGITADPDGVYRLPDGRAFRLPTGRDELAVEAQLTSLSPERAEERLLERCLVGYDLADAGADRAGEAVAGRLVTLAPAARTAAQASGGGTAVPAAGTARTVQEAMEMVAPVIDLDLDARCPECNADQPVHFDLQSYLLESLLDGRRRLLGEVYRLAVTLYWSRDEILGLARHERLAYLELIAADAEGSPRWNP